MQINKTISARKGQAEQSECSQYHFTQVLSDSCESWVVARSKSLQDTWCFHIGHELFLAHVRTHTHQQAGLYLTSGSKTDIFEPGRRISGEMPDRKTFIEVGDSYLSPPLGFRPDKVTISNADNSWGAMKRNMNWNNGVGVYLLNKQNGFVIA